MQRNTKGLFKTIKYKVYVVWPLIALSFFGILILIERVGITQETVEQHTDVPIEWTKEQYQKPGTLVVRSSADSYGKFMQDQICYVLDCMKVPYDIKYAENVTPDSLQQYEKVVLAITDLNRFADLRIITNWVEQGGKVMNLATYDIHSNFQLLKGKIGILEGATDYVKISGFTVDENFMLGEKDRKYYFDDSYEFSLNALLQDTATVYAWDLDEKTPLLWKNPYGDGLFVTINMALYDKTARGFWASAYRLLDDISVYPVIDASAFYLDDFPSPVPGGNGDYIWRDYGVDISTFYSNIWWNDMLSWEEEYGIIHTGLIIEDYSDIVEPPFDRMKAIDRFRFFGNMLLNQGGELGFHGYNHMPLCLEGFDYKGLYDNYNLWPSIENMKQSLTELKQFSSDLYYGNQFRVYVPPSNILSPEGRQAIKEALPDIKIIASTYLPGDCAYEQEYEIAEDGLIETPRITSGMILDDYTYQIAFSELNFHYVQSHFTHPDDVLDEDRGAELGWPKMKQNFSEYLSYIYHAAPNIRNVTGSEMGEAVATYERLSLKRQLKEDGLEITIGGFNGHASFMVAVNLDGKEIVSVEGGTVEQLTDTLYILHATNNIVEIRTDEKMKGVEAR